MKFLMQPSSRCIFFIFIFYFNSFQGYASNKTKKNDEKLMQQNNKILSFLLLYVQCKRLLEGRGGQGQG